MGEHAAGDLLAGRFRLRRLLGSGARAHVWQADEVGTGHAVAVKLPRDAAAAALLETAHQLMLRLAHPGILRPLEWLRGDTPVQVLPLCEPAGLGALRGAGWREIVAVLAGVAEALEYAHRQGVVHGDLKASNVLRAPGGAWLVADIGAGEGSLPASSPERLDGSAPGPGDDLYGLGALAIDLLTGAPLFHPDVTPERVRTEAPVIPRVDLAGNALPERLTGLLASLLAKSRAARPTGMGTVRAALEDLASDTAGAADVPRILPRPRAALSAATEPAAPVGAGRRGGVPAKRVYAALGLVAIAALAVIFALPQVAREPVRSPSRAATPAPVPTAAPTATTAEQQAEVDAALGEFMRRDDELRKLNPERWGGATWEELRRRVTAADEALKARNAAVAVAGYRAAAALAAELLGAAPATRDSALAEGAAALAAGEQARAIDAFERALAISPDSPTATAGLARARQVDRVLGLMADADAAEVSGQRDAAIRSYQQVLALDPAWRPAQEALGRLRAAAAVDAYQRQMADGFAAQSRQDYAGARAAFRAALTLRPGDAAARAALTQVESDGSFAALGDAAGEAARLEAAERWSEAVVVHDRALASDPNLVEQRAARDRAAARAALDADLVRSIAAADQYNDDAIVRGARTALERARAVAPPGPRLAQQIAELMRLIAVGTTPVSVRLESDTLTEVTVFKVGRMGSFATRELELRPGVYTAVGSRVGFRDVRLQFRVRAGVTEPVVVRCEEAI